MAELPRLPHGSSSILSGLSETFAFHSSPESFITSRVLDFHKKHPELAVSRVPIRAQVLNRNIAIISSYEQIKKILCKSHVAEKLSSSLAYDELMAPFFPPPNLLLSDPPHHTKWKVQWTERMKVAMPEMIMRVSDIVRRHFNETGTGQQWDLYDYMKDLAWKLLLSAFLTTAGSPQKDDDGLFEDIMSLQDELLHGQFSLFPVSVNIGVWSSPRSKGIAARKKLQRLLRQHLQRSKSHSPFNISDPREMKDIANHILLFTSSLAVKALASLLTAVLMQVCARHESSQPLSLLDKIRALPDSVTRLKVIEKIIHETERVSPPIVGIMRRATSDIVLQPCQPGDNATLIPKGWDIWMYFAGAGRDTPFIGTLTSNAGQYIDTNGQENKGLAFGAGPKACLGRDFVHEIIAKVIQTMVGLDDNGTLTAVNSHQIVMPSIASIPIGVQAWLGWQQDVKPEDWARDMKQLPVQRPAKPVLVTFKANKPVAQVEES